MYDSKQLDSFRYAQMQSSILNKTSSSSSGNKINLVSKFTNLKASLDQIQSQLRTLTNDTQESQRVARHMSTDLADREMMENKNQLNQQIKKFQKQVKTGIAEAQNRSELIREQCKNRTKNTEQLKTMMTQLRTRVSRLQNTLGYFPVGQNVM